MIRYFVKVIPNASENQVITLSFDKLKVKLSTPPEKGKANKSLINLLAKHFNVPKSRVVLLSGENTRDKVIGIMHD